MIVHEEGSDSEEEEASSLGEEEERDQRGEEEAASDNATRNESSSDQPLAAARDHSYLNASHPLLPEDSALCRDYKRPRSSMDAVTNDHDAAFNNLRSRESFELPVLVLHGVVLFPGSTIPIKLRNRSMIQYLGRQIQKCRTHPELQPKVELGILTFCSEQRSRTQRNDDDNVNDDDLGLPRWRRIAARANQHRPPSQNPRYRENNGEDRLATLNPYIGRIGTIATISHTHERTSSGLHTGNNEVNSNSSGTVWDQYETTNELVVTSVGTSRFRIIDIIDEHRTIFLVEELVDDSMARPYSQRLFSSSPNESTGLQTPDDYVSVVGQDQVAWNVAQVTPLPYFVHRIFSPWCMMERIRGVLMTNAGGNNLPSLGEDEIGQKYSEPTQFSFWIANNLPLKESQRLRLLELHSTLERLKIVWKEIQRMLERPSVIRCADCGLILSFTNDVFTVGGAEGSTSTYVNGGGYIHQITTLRKLIDENKVVFEGYPSTENSYFPGYSWHITRCRRCAALLGWKFRQVDGRNSTSADRPETFFGFMSSIVTADR
ncbi:ATP-dependent protease La LON substrate-binding domain containing protein [Nitzschia inconspicua]|uniref:ATP-dependent protease La LON substrate-binding domain containing protein n=1 Tax=Nitzschia inconspicua TaxID=303405 RepID=A0A9K3KTQ2_9STRA|nr:ATP-dependent protease La LON substrate-binding domain containing protein [Nitzschia inconspicua]